MEFVHKDQNTCMENG